MSIQFHLIEIKTRPRFNEKWMKKMNKYVGVGVMLSVGQACRRNGNANDNNVYSMLKIMWQFALSRSEWLRAESRDTSDSDTTIDSARWCFKRMHASRARDTIKHANTSGGEAVHIATASEAKTSAQRKGPNETNSILICPNLKCQKGTESRNAEEQGRQETKIKYAASIAGTHSK